MKKTIAAHYLKTGICGAYETAEVIDDVEINGKAAPCFDDSTSQFDETYSTIRRTMVIGGNRFHVCSVLITDGKTTPTDQMLRLIDADLEGLNSR